MPAAITPTEAFPRLIVRDADEVVVEIKDRPCGKREGRIRDPFGHLWILSQQVAG